jgi:hypothetical protein
MISIALDLSEADAQPKKLRKVEDYRPIAYVILNSSEGKDDRKENQSG